MRRYLHLFLLFLKVGLMRAMAYRPHFFMMIAGKVIRIGLLFFFFQAIFFQVDRIGQWSFDGVLLLFATFQIVDFLMSITFDRNIAFFLPQRIQSLARFARAHRVHRERYQPKYFSNPLHPIFLT